MTTDLEAAPAGALAEPSPPNRGAAAPSNDGLTLQERRLAAARLTAAALAAASLSACGGGGGGGAGAGGVGLMALGAGSGGGAAGAGAGSASAAGTAAPGSGAAGAPAAGYGIDPSGAPPDATLAMDSVDPMPAEVSGGAPAAPTRQALTLRHPGRYTTPRSDAEAARFLLQAQFSASEAQIAAVRQQGYLPWLSAQFDMHGTTGAREWLERQPYRTTPRVLDMDAMMWRQLIRSADAVRKRLALALSEIFVVSGNDIGSGWPQHMMGQYWDMLVRNVGGNFRQLLEDVTLNPAMGYFLNMRGNRKENAQGRQPDENFAREVMQLMTIGLVQLEADGRARTDGRGRPIDSYGSDDVTNLARVFTGYDLDIRPSERQPVQLAGTHELREQPAWTTRPMVCNEAQHSMLEARFLGATVPAGTPAAQALKIALDTLFNHPNVGPFIGRQLIQRLVTSNPSPAYVQRVAQVFADNGRGVRGDMRSVFAAVLLDDEARGPAGLTDPTFGRLREPMVRVVQWARTFRISSAQDTWRIGNLSDPAVGGGQSPLRAPSVFNFFRPGYVPPGSPVAARQLVAPEFQLVNETSVAAYLNWFQQRLVYGMDARDMMPDFRAELGLVLDVPRLLQRLNLLLTGGQLSQATLDIMARGLEDARLTARSSEADKLRRIHGAVLMVLASPEYLIQK